MLAYVVCSLTLSVTLFYTSKILWRIYILSTARDPNSKFSHLPIPPGDFGLPIIGETLTWAAQGSRFNLIRRQKYGNIFSSNYIGKTMVKVTGPEYIKQVLTASSKDLHTIWPTSMRRIVGESSIANSIGAMHKYRRKVFAKGLTHAALSSYIPEMHAIIKNRMETWIHSIDAPLVYPGVKEMTFEVAFRILVGLSFSSKSEQHELYNTFDSMVSNLFSLPYEFPGSGLSKALKCKKIVHDILDDHLKKKQVKVLENIQRGEYAAESSDQSMKNVLHFTLEALLAASLSEQNGGPTPETGEMSGGENDDEIHALSIEELKETTVEMLFAGYQTVASSAASAVINLIKHPEVFQNLEDELRQFGLLPEVDVEIDGLGYLDENSDTLSNNNKSDINSNLKITSSIKDQINPTESKVEITFELLAKMQYLEQVMKETLRVAPPILGGYRKALRTFQLGNYRVPKGWTIIYNITDTHEAEWSEDKKFDPDRFSPEIWKENKESRFRWIPFGGGPRVCIGKDFARLQFKLFIIELVRHCSAMEFANGKPPKMFALPFLHPTDGLPVRFTPRNITKQYSENKKMK